MMKDSNFFEKRFEEKRFVNVSVCQSNIKAKKGTYYGRVCKIGHINTKQLLQIVKDRTSYIDIPMVESALEKIADVMLDMVGQGYSVEFSKLGTFSLSTQGKIEMGQEEFSQHLSQNLVEDTSLKSSYSMLHSEGASINAQNFALQTRDSAFILEKEVTYVKNALGYDSDVRPFAMREEDESEIEEMNGNYDVSEKVKGEVHFAFKFSPSKTLKASMQNIKMNLAIKKGTAPLIVRAEDALPALKSEEVKVIKLTGNNLKIAGDDEKVGIYIEEKIDEEKVSPFMIRLKPVKVIKLSASSLIQNENKTLMFLADGILKRGVEYCITVITQSTPSGKIGKMLRKGSLCMSLKL